MKETEENQFLWIGVLSKRTDYEIWKRDEGFTLAQGNRELLIAVGNPIATHPLLPMFRASLQVAFWMKEMRRGEKYNLLLEPAMENINEEHLGSCVPQRKCVF